MWKSYHGELGPGVHLLIVFGDKTIKLTVLIVDQYSL